MALEALEKGGTVSLAGIYMTPIPELDYAKHLYHEKTLRSAATSTRRDVRELLQLAGENPIQTEGTAISLGGCLRSRGTGEWNRVRCTF